MKILTWNINGIRTAKIQLKELFDSLDADIICIQETKVTRDQLDERSAIVDGYSSYYSFSKTKSGYSGVATYAKDSATPWKVEEGLSGGFRSENEDDNIGFYGDQSNFSDEELKSLDSEGRSIITQHKIIGEDGNMKLLTIINVYCPRADPERPERGQFQLRFYELLQIRAEAVLTNNSHVIILGDINASHRRIDHCDPDECPNFEKRPGRVWLNQLVWDPKAPEDAENTSKLVDTFRYLHPDQQKAFTCWQNATGARLLNYGTRIDYILADQKLGLNVCEDCIVMADVEGSDHCPVKATFNCETIPCKRCPPLCTKYMPEFIGKQQKLDSYFTKAKAKVNDSVDKVSNDSSLPVVKEGVKNCLTEVSIKRQASDTLKGSLAKRLKKESSGKQSSLKTFFGSKEVKQKVESETNSVPLEVKSGANENTRSVEPPPATTNNQSKTAAVNSWKNFMKPRAVPLCRGHNEPCVSRTVKKDGPNKGRIFYVCTRPDGPKTNPEARCEHFEWLDKRKK